MHPLLHRVTLAFTFALFAASAGLPGSAVAARSGSDTMTAEAPPVGPFNRVTISGLAEVVLIQGDREAVVIEAEPKSQARIRVRSSDGRLSVEAGDSRPWWSVFGMGTGHPPTITIYFRTLDALTVSGAVKVEAAAIQSPELRISASGATSIELTALKTDSLDFSGSGAVKAKMAGDARRQNVSISGAGRYQAPELRSETADVSVSGAGRVIVNARKALSASISGAGSIDYYGDPKVSQRISGAGKINRRGAGASPASLRTA